MSKEGIWVMEVVVFLFVERDQGKVLSALTLSSFSILITTPASLNLYSLVSSSSKLAIASSVSLMSGYVAPVLDIL